jgi:uncharacterized protein
MSYYAAIREAGPGWTGNRGVMEQPGVSDHAAFMTRLAEEGFVLFAGPLAGTEHGRLRAMLIVDAESEADIEKRLADDPWTGSERLQITSIEPWTIFVGAERLGG